MFSACYDPERHPNGCTYASWVAPLLMTPYLCMFSACYDPERHPNGCTYASWVAPLLMTPYLLVANILLVNLLIARFK